MSLSPSFSDFPASTGSNSAFTPASSFTHDRATAASMSLIPVLPPQDTSSQPVADRKMPNPASPTTPIDRRSSAEGTRAGVERRQFGSSHSGLSDAGCELAAAIDQYKLQHHRRYITCDEMLLVLNSLGYEKSNA